MARFDVAVGFDQNSMTGIAGEVYRRVYPQLFTGSQTLEGHGAKVDVSWDVKTAPTFDLSPFSGETPATLVMNIATMNVTLNDGHSSGSSLASVAIFIQVTTTEKTISFVPVRANATTDDSIDEYIINAVILPKLLAMTQTLLSGIEVPALSFSGVTLGQLAVAVTGNHVVIMANLAGEGVADPAGFTPPDLPFFMLLSSNLRAFVLREVSSRFSHEFEKDGSLGIGIGNANYKASATIARLSLFETSSALSYEFNANITGNVNAGVNMEITTVGVDYDLTAFPNPRGSAEISVNGTTVRARITNISTLYLALNPTGNVAQRILSALTYPLAQSLELEFAPVISGAVLGLGFDFVTIPNVPITVHGFTFTVSPSNLSLADPGGGYLQVQGNVTVK